MSEAPAANTSKSPFWRFSLRFYACEGVAPACLALQDEAGVDVNLMLFLLFLAEMGRTVTREDVARLDGAVAPWRKEVVEPLRGLRRKLKAGAGNVPIEKSESLRSLVKRVELESERVEQEVLEGFVSSIGTRASSTKEAASRNLISLSAYLRPLPEKEIQTLLTAFTDTPPSAHSPPD